MTNLDRGGGGDTSTDVELEEPDAERFLDDGRPDVLGIILFVVTLATLSVIEAYTFIQETLVGYYSSAIEFSGRLTLDVIGAPFNVASEGSQSVIASSFEGAAAEMVAFEILAFLVAALFVVVWFLVLDRVWAAVRRWT